MQQAELQKVKEQQEEEKHEGKPVEGEVKEQ